MKSQVVEETCKKRATEFKESYLNKLKQLQSSPLYVNKSIFLFILFLINGAIFIVHMVS